MPIRRSQRKLQPLDLDEILQETLKYIPRNELEGFRLVSKQWKREADRALKKRSNYWAVSKEKLEESSHKCQFCRVQHTDLTKAVHCISNHGCLRCYLCYKLCATTEQLFKHFEHSHTPGKNPNTVICPFCQIVIPFRSVSLHIIIEEIIAKRNKKD